MKYETPARARAQLERDARLRTAGYEVVHFTWPEITRAPAQVVDAIQLAFRRSGAR
jgi:very-short-patch-repair endonuclease